jgi:hypothetical protein
MKMAGVPMLIMVEATFRAMMPDLPTPVSTTFPFKSAMILTAFAKLSLSGRQAPQGPPFRCVWMLYPAQ